MKRTIKYTALFLLIFVVFLGSAGIGNWVLLSSGCIWTSSVSFGVSMLAGLGFVVSLLQIISDLTHLF